MSEALLKTPSGWSDRPDIESNVNILSFVFGPHRDGASYDRSAVVAQAIVSDANGRLSAVPISWLRVGKREAP